MQTQKIIEQLGYTAREAKVYLAVLALGEAHISDIATSVKIPRSSAQNIVDKLHAEGLVNFYVMRRYKYWVAENPEKVLADFKHRVETMEEALPVLNAIGKAARRTRRLDKSYKESVETLRMLADTSLLPVLITSKDAQIEYVNEPWQKLFGYSLEEMHGEYARTLRSGKTPPEVYDRMWKVLASGKLFHSNEIIDRQKNGTYFHFHTSIFPLTHGRRTFYVQILSDIVDTV